MNVWQQLSAIYIGINLYTECTPKTQFWHIVAGAFIRPLSGNTANVAHRPDELATDKECKLDNASGDI